MPRTFTPPADNPSRDLVQVPRADTRLQDFNLKHLESKLNLNGFCTPDRLALITMGDIRDMGGITEEEEIIIMLNLVPSLRLNMPEIRRGNYVVDHYSSCFLMRDKNGTTIADMYFKIGDKYFLEILDDLYICRICDPNGDRPCKLFNKSTVAEHGRKRLKHKVKKDALVKELACNRNGKRKRSSRSRRSRSSNRSAKRKRSSKSSARSKQGRCCTKTTTAVAVAGEEEATTAEAVAAPAPASGTTAAETEAGEEEATTAEAVAAPAPASGTTAAETEAGEEEATTAVAVAAPAPASGTTAAETEAGEEEATTAEAVAAPAPASGTTAAETVRARIPRTCKRGVRYSACCTCVDNCFTNALCSNWSDGIECSSNNCRLETCDNRNIEKAVLPTLLSKQCSNPAKGFGLFAGPEASASVDQLLLVFSGGFSGALTQIHRSYTLEFTDECLPNVADVVLPGKCRSKYRYFVPDEPGRRLNSSVKSNDAANAVLKVMLTKSNKVLLCLYATHEVKCNDEIIANYSTEFEYKCV